MFAFMRYTLLGGVEVRVCHGLAAHGIFGYGELCQPGVSQHVGDDPRQKVVVFYFKHQMAGPEHRESSGCERQRSPEVGIEGYAHIAGLVSKNASVIFHSNDRGEPEC